MLCRSLYACPEDCVVYVLAWKCHFVQKRGPCACVNGCVMYVLDWKLQFVHKRGPCACVQGCVMSLLANASLCTIYIGACACVVGCVMYVLAWKHQFICPCEDHFHAQWTVQCLIVHPRKLQFMNFRSP